MPRTHLQRAACLIAGLLFTACSQGSAPSASSVPAGTLLQNSAGADGFTWFLAGAHFNGGASNLRVQRVLWGRLVDLYALDSGTGARQKLIRDLLVRPDLQSDGTDYLLESHPITQREELTILHDFGTPEFEAAFQPLRDEVGLAEFLDKGLGANALPPFTAVPRNATVVVEFNDLLDPATVNGLNVKVLKGYPPSAPHETRVVPDRSRGGLVGSVQYSTRVIIDPTISPSDAQSLGLSANARGFPAASSALLINMGLRIPTKINPSAAQFGLLSNLAGKPLSLDGNGSADAGSPTQDVVRGFRSGGPHLATGDLFNGYLYDVDPPEVVGTLAVTIDAAAGPISPDQFLATLTFAALPCAVQPRAGDILTANNGVYEVVSPGAPLAGATVVDVGLAWISESPSGSSAPQLGAAELRTPWDSTLGMTPGCFVTFEGPATTPPVTGVPTNATVRISFSEPMDPDSVNVFDGIQISDPTVPANQPLKRTVVGKMAASESLLSFLFQPSMPFKHTSGASETFHLNVLSFTDPLTDLVFGVTDLAGNTISDLLPQVSFTLRNSDPTLSTGSVALRFTSLNEDNDPGGFPEIRGQVVYDLSRGVMMPRAVTRFSAFLDTSGLTSEYVQTITPVGGVVEPLSIHGSRLQSLWRYRDMGFDNMMEDAYLNLDVEGMAWMVAGSGVQIDNFPAFKMSLAHSRYIADDAWGTIAMATVLFWPQSGLTTTFADNVADALEVVSPLTAGYFIQSIDQFQTPSATLMMPFPLNRNMPVSAFSYFTWRDTTKLVLGGLNSGGAPIPQPAGGGALVGPVVPAPPKIYEPGQVPTIGLPLLFDIQTFPAPTTANGLNLLNIGGVNFGTFNQPFFRAHSTGGFNASNQPVTIDPSAQITAIGGLAPGGIPTPPADSGFYYGNADFVTRVSVLHTIWFDAGAVSQFDKAVTLPVPGDVPAGLGLHFAFRGATQLTGTAVNQINANQYDPYGDPLQPGSPFGVTFLNGDNTWKSDLSELSGARFVQVRVTFVGDAETGAVPELDAIGFSFAGL